MELLHNYYIGLINNTQTTQKVNEINTVIKPDKKDEKQCSITKHIYQNIQKKQPREKIWTIPFLFESPRNKDLEIDYLIDSGAKSNITNIPTWNEIKTLHPNLTALIQTTLDGAAQKWFSVLPIEIKSDWKRFTQEFSKMFNSERNKQHQRVLCNEIRNETCIETIEQLAVRIETLARKAYSLNTHDYKNTKMTEILMMTLTPQLRKIATKKRTSHPSSIREPDLDFRKLEDKLEQAEITMKLEETENLKLQYVNRIETNTTHINNIQESDTGLIEKITEILNICEKHPNLKVRPSFKNGVIIADDTEQYFRM